MQYTMIIVLRYPFGTSTVEIILTRIKEYALESSHVVQAQLEFRDR